MSLFSEEQKQVWKQAKSFKVLARTVLMEMLRQKAVDGINEQNSTWIGLSFPITSGGLGCQSRNTKRAKQLLEALKTEGLRVFNPLEFQDELYRILEIAQPDDHYELVHGFYGPIFETFPFDEIRRPFDWQTSQGCRIENDYILKNSNAPRIIEISEEVMREIIYNAQPVA